jgi:type I restriction enzyme S subunit
MRENPKLDDACSITTGKLDSNHFVVGGQYPFFTCAPEPLTIDSYAFDDSVILIAGNNASGNFHVNRYKGKFNAYQRTYVLTAKPGYDLDYVFYSLKMELKRLKEKSQGSQTKFLTLPILKNIDVTRRALPLQKKIAAVLVALDSKIDLNNRMNAKLEAMAKTLYDYWFVQFDFPDQLGKPYKSTGGKMIWNDVLKREIPDGWEVGTLLDIADYDNGLPCQNFRPTGNDSLRVIKIREMNEGFSSDSELTRVDIPQKAIIENGDVLFSWSASLELKIWTGGKGALNQHIFKVTSKRYPKSFYYYQLVNYLRHFKMMAENRKTTMGHITQEHLQQSRIVLPRKEIALELEKLIAPLIEKRIDNELQNQRLAELRDWLLPMLMNGQVTVNEPAKLSP